MNKALKSARQNLRLTQQQAAARLGVSQPYFAQLESGKRRFSLQLARRAVRELHASPSVVPCAGGRRRLTTPEAVQHLPQQLSGLGYPGFASLRAGWRRNPAEVLLHALEQETLEPRVAEALPWVLLQYPDMDHKWLVSQVRLKNLSNRLGFTVALARGAAERRNQQESAAYKALATLEDELQKSRLDYEDDFGNPSMSANEREWVRANRSPDAVSWHVLSDWKPEHLQYV